MADDTDVLLQLCSNEWEQSRHLEDQRATITNIILVIASVILGFVAQRGAGYELLPLTILLGLLGIYGAVVTEKLYERYTFHSERARGYLRRIDELQPNAQVLALRSQADAKHNAEARRLKGIPLHALWTFLHIAISITGVVLTVLILVLYK